MRAAMIYADRRAGVYEGDMVIGAIACFLNCQNNEYQYCIALPAPAAFVALLF